MKKHAYIYSYEGMTSGIVGWILQQSPSYKSNFFKFDTELNDISGKVIWAPYSDPWDNHSDDDDHWSHAYIKCIEKHNRDFSWLDEFAATFKERTIFGLSYGAYWKRRIWPNPDVQVILSAHSTKENFNRYKNLFIKSYWERPFSLEEVIESIDMHSHDHHGDDQVYKLRLLQKIVPAFELAKTKGIKFWQLQMLYHHNAETFPFESAEIQTDLMHLYQTEVCSIDLEATVFSRDKKTDVLFIDIFDMDLDYICEKLNIEQSENMTTEYNRFLEFCNEFGI